jgi:hypothetical protein
MLNEIQLHYLIFNLFSVSSAAVPDATLPPASMQSSVAIKQESIV